MYSGTTLTLISGRVLGAHQKIDKLAYTSLRRSATLCKQFPTSQHILHFEGLNGPDAIKRKSPAQDEPWHYYAPFNPDDTQLLDTIAYHHDRLVSALKAADDTRASFEAAWLAHAIVDGLTPAHHYPYEEALTELRGEGIESRTSLKGKLLMPGETRRDQVKNNWKMWGPKGLLTTHGFFEWGIAAIIKPLSVSHNMQLSQKDMVELDQLGLLEVFKMRAKEVAALEMYKTYYELGWTPRLATQIRRELIPIIVRTVALAWYSAAEEAECGTDVPKPLVKTKEGTKG